MLSFNCILDLAWHRWIKLTLELKYMFLSYTANRMPADALETLGIIASVSTLLAHKAVTFRFQHQKSYYLMCQWTAFNF